MAINPLPVLAQGYGLAAAAAALGLAVGAFGPVAAGLTAWIGGALATLAVAALRGRTARDAGDGTKADAALAEAMRRWEEDRETDHRPGRKRSGAA